MIASARTPGASSSMGVCDRDRFEVLDPGDAADEDQHRDDQREQDLLAVAEQQSRLHPGLGQDLPAERAQSRASG